MGKKIKTFAKVIMLLGMTVCLVLAAYTLISCYDRNLGFHLLQYATVNGGVTNPYSPARWESQGNDIYNSIQTAIYFGIGFVGCLFAGLPLYWFGCLFERVEHIEKTLNERIKQEESK